MENLLPELGPATDAIVPDRLGSRFASKKGYRLAEPGIAP
jgi:hypothetical protein